MFLTNRLAAKNRLSSCSAPSIPRPRKRPPTRYVSFNKRLNSGGCYLVSRSSQSLVQTLVGLVEAGMSDNQLPKVLLFDIGGVCVSLRPVR